MTVFEYIRLVIKVAALVVMVAHFDNYRKAKKIGDVMGQIEAQGWMTFTSIIAYA